jgi:IclR family acetate operon transcriptional repressor
MDFMSKLKPGDGAAVAPRSAPGMAKALDKGLALVDILSAKAPIRLGELVDLSGLPRPTAVRLLDVLREHGVVEVSQDGTYSLGPRLAAWGHRYLDRVDLPRQAVDIMASLAESTRETCFLGVRDDLQVLYVAKADSPQAVRPAAQIGSRNPLYCTAIGKALLAFGPAEVAERCLREPLVGRTPNTITDVSRLEEELEVTRARGYSTDDVENEDGVRCVAVPIRDHTGATVAAMSVSAPAYRFELSDLPDLAPQVIAAANELSRRIGYSPQETPAS